VNGHTAIIRSFGITGVLLLLALVMLAIVSAIVAFDRWPQAGGASTVERVAVDRPSARRVDTVLVRSRRPAPVVRGVFVARSGTSASALGPGDVFLVRDREPTDQIDGGGFGPPPPSVPSVPPGEGGGPARFVGTGNNGPGPEPPPPRTFIQEATCGARDALGDAGTSLDPACSPETPGGGGGRDAVPQALGDTVTDAGTLVRGTASGVTETAGLGGGGQ
jgi:hypothetical protein